MLVSAIKMVTIWGALVISALTAELRLNVLMANAVVLSVRKNIE